MRLQESALQLFYGLPFLHFRRVSGNTWELGNASPQILILLVSVAPGDFAHRDAGANPWEPQPANRPHNSSPFLEALANHEQAISLLGFKHAPHRVGVAVGGLLP